MKTKKTDEWIVVSLLLLALFVVFLLYPMAGLLKQSVFNGEGQFLSLIHISEPTRQNSPSRMPSSA